MNKEIISLICCPISGQIFLNPVMTEDGQVYEKKMIKKWLKNNNTSPVTNLKISKKLIPNYHIRNLVNIYLKENPESKQKQYTIPKNFVKNSVEIYKILKDKKFELLLSFKNFYLDDKIKIKKEKRIHFIKYFLKYCKDFDIIKYVIDNSKDLNVEYNRTDDDIKLTIFHYSTKYSTKELLNYLFDKKKKDCTVTVFNPTNLIDSMKLLFIAAKYNRVDNLNYFLDLGADIDKPNIEYDTHNKFTPFHIACKNGHEEIIKILVEKNCNINAANMYSFSINMACRICSYKIIKFLIKKGADLKKIHKSWSPISHIFESKLSENEIMKIVDYHIKKKIFIHYNLDTDSYSIHPHKSIRSFSNEFIKSIYPKINKVINPSPYGICEYLFSENEDIVKFIIDNTDFTILNKINIYYGYTPVFYIIKKQNIEVVKYFIETTKPDLNIKSDGGDTPLDFARKYANNEIINYLIEKSNINL